MEMWRGLFCVRGPRAFVSRVSWLVEESGGGGEREGGSDCALVVCCLDQGGLDEYCVDIHSAQSRPDRRWRVSRSPWSASVSSSDLTRPVADSYVQSSAVPGRWREARLAWRSSMAFSVGGWVCACIRLGCLFVAGGRRNPRQSVKRYSSYTTTSVCSRSRTLVVIACVAASSRTEPGTCLHNTTQHNTANTTLHHKSRPSHPTSQPHPAFRCSHWSTLGIFFFYINPSSSFSPSSSHLLSALGLTPIGHSVRVAKSDLSPEIYSVTVCHATMPVTGLLPAFPGTHGMRDARF